MNLRKSSLMSSRLSWNRAGAGAASSCRMPTRSPPAGAIRHLRNAQAQHGHVQAWLVRSPVRVGKARPPLAFQTAQKGVALAYGVEKKAVSGVHQDRIARTREFATGRCKFLE